MQRFVVSSQSCATITTKSTKFHHPQKALYPCTVISHLLFPQALANTNFLCGVASSGNLISKESNHVFLALSACLSLSIMFHTHIASVRTSLIMAKNSSLYGSPQLFIHVSVEGHLDSYFFGCYNNTVQLFLYRFFW